MLLKESGLPILSAGGKKSVTAKGIALATRFHCMLIDI